MGFQKGHKINVGRSGRRFLIRLYPNFGMRGKKLSEEARKKISEACLKRKRELGYIHSIETREKMSLSHRGKKLSKETKEKIGKIHIGKKHTEEAKRKMSINSKGKNKGIKLTEEHRKKLSLSHLERKNKLGYINSEETRRKLSSSLRGKKRTPFSEECKKKMGVSHKRLWINRNYREKQLIAQKIGANIKPNKPEQLLINLIKENNLPFNYVGDGKIWFRGETQSFNPDFLSKNPKHIIEIFGNYWHNIPDIKERDKERLETYAKYGYKTLVIWEHELKNPQEIINKIQNLIK